MNIIKKLKQIQNQKNSGAKYVLSIIPEQIINDKIPDIIEIIGKQTGQTHTETYQLDKMFYSHEVQTIITKALQSAYPIRILCVRPNPVLRPNTYKVYKIQTRNDESHDWIDMQNMSKIFPPQPQ